MKQLESIYRSATVVANICVYAAQDKHKPIAIIVPAEPALKKLASEKGVSGEHLEELCHDPKINSAVLQQMQQAGKAGGLASFEIIDGVVLADEEWTPQNVSCLCSLNRASSANHLLQGLVTAAQKLNRKGILDKYKKDVEKAYAHS